MTSQPERCAELEALTRGLYAAVSVANADFFERHLSHDACCVVIGTAPGDWWDDFEAAMAAIRAQMNAAGEAITLTAGDVQAWHAGDVGWVSDQPVIRIGGAEARCRHTSVFVRRNEVWQIVQHQFSIGIANEDVFGPEATHLG